MLGSRVFFLQFNGEGFIYGRRWVGFDNWKIHGESFYGRDKFLLVYILFYDAVLAVQHEQLVLLFSTLLRFLNAYIRSP